MIDEPTDESPVERADRVLAANIEFHTALAAEYDEKQPHYRPENVARVDAILADMAERTGGGSLLDLGCGTGFIMNLAKRHFRRVVGVDVTTAMLDLVDRSGGTVEVFEANTEDLPFEDGEFDACTAYGFLHHLYDMGPTFREASRCLRRGGRFYSDQDPNRHFWTLMHALRSERSLPPHVLREARSVVDVEDDLSAEINLDPETIALAEFQKVKHGGLDPDAVVPMLEVARFTTAGYRYEWFLGQGAVLHEQSATAANTIEKFLRGGLPATRHLFKYVAFHAER